MAENSKVSIMAVNNMLRNKEHYIDISINQRVVHDGRLFFASVSSFLGYVTKFGYCYCT